MPAMSKMHTSFNQPHRGTADANGGLRGRPASAGFPRGLGGSATNKLGGARTSPCLQERMIPDVKKRIILDILIHELVVSFYKNQICALSQARTVSSSHTLHDTSQISNVNVFLKGRANRTKSSFS